jgi:hypothetical protein
MEDTGQITTMWAETLKKSIHTMPEQWMDNFVSDLNIL